MSRLIFLVIFLFIFNSSAAFAAGPLDFMDYRQKVQVACLQIGTGTSSCQKLPDLKISFLNRLQIECETYRQNNGCDQIEHQTIEKINKIKDENLKKSKLKDVDKKIIGCNQERICPETKSSEALSCGYDFGHGLLDSIVSMILLPYNSANRSVKNGPSGTFFTPLYFYFS